MGGAVKAIETSYIQQEIAASAYAYQKDIESGEKKIVGVNAFTLDEDIRPEILRIDESLREKQIGRLRAHRSARSGKDVTTALSAVEQSAREDRNLMPPILAAVTNGATVGEIASVLRNVWGEFDAG
jgi:methylmalonyl-CoA mutase N-terminal domain/subunit